MNKCKNCLHPFKDGLKKCSKCSIPLFETNLNMSVLMTLQSENGSSYSFSKKITTIGRKGDIGFPNDLFMSKIHAEILLDNGFLIINDKKSQNGVLVNGVRITKKTRLQKKDEVLCGKTKFEVL